MKNWARYTLSVDVPNYDSVELRYGGEKEVCNLQVLFQYSSQSTKKGNRDVLEAMFAVKAGDGMSGHSCRIFFFSCPGNAVVYNNILRFCIHGEME